MKFPLYIISIILLIFLSLSQGQSTLGEYLKEKRKDFDTSEILQKVKSVFVPNENVEGNEQNQQKSQDILDQKNCSQDELSQNSNNNKEAEQIDAPLEDKEPNQ